MFQHTAARRRLAGRLKSSTWRFCFNTQPPEGGWLDSISAQFIHQCFNTQPPEGGWDLPMYSAIVSSSFNTQPPEGGWRYVKNCRKRVLLFQHTAARRRLVPSTQKPVTDDSCFNTQPPEGGWNFRPIPDNVIICFNTQPPEGGWSLSQKPCSIRFRSPDFAKLLKKSVNTSITQPCPLHPHSQYPDC